MEHPDDREPTSQAYELVKGRRITGRCLHSQRNMLVISKSRVSQSTNTNHLLQLHLKTHPSATCTHFQNREAHVEMFVCLTKQHLAREFLELAAEQFAINADHAAQVEIKSGRRAAFSPRDAILIICSTDELRFSGRTFGLSRRNVAETDKCRPQYLQTTIC
jgi:hypothetical protein